MGRGDLVEQPDHRGAVESRRGAGAVALAIDQDVMRRDAGLAHADQHDVLDGVEVAGIGCRAHHVGLVDRNVGEIVGRRIDQERFGLAEVARPRHLHHEHELVALQIGAGREIGGRLQRHAAAIILGIALEEAIALVAEIGIDGPAVGVGDGETALGVGIDVPGRLRRGAGHEAKQDGNRGINAHPALAAGVSSSTVDEGTDFAKPVC